ncbi:MAG: imidazole glycerol phosphate synthase subunit HisH [Desulfobacterales bacterium]|jgi:glutamine amidotransferase|nr:imidazole glycerol phosphate synthase subunit HisH [Desulfobacterales bacterium]MDP6808182.1 imidazole glycerol phosphate synthase subunit HisH [Desulfobacterales bacterium]|tara:strand:+ start:46457 stop:47074 length:618 start_codon:yes stop_codon:yes gene_type:complete
MIVIIDFGIGNIGSILNMLKKLGGAAICSADRDTIKNADKLILPGVGSFDHAISKLKASGLVQILNRLVLERQTPILGICLGMQLFAKKSEEGKIKGLGWIDATVKRFDFEEGVSNLKIPHMGWNRVEIQKEIILFDGMPDNHRFYFVHSYHLECHGEGNVAGLTRYGYPFVSMIRKGNIFGVQFHPEKSHRYGMQLLKNFAEIS